MDGDGVVHQADPEWYLARARALRNGLIHRLGECGAGETLVKCQCGPRRVPTRCGLKWLCDRCRRKKYKRERARNARALKAHRDASRRAWELLRRTSGYKAARGRERRLTHIVLTAPHCADMAETRERIRAAFERLRKWMHMRLTRKGELGQFVYAMAWEVTPGVDCCGKGCPRCPGHPHAHVVALWPYEDWTEVQEEWRRALGNESTRINLQSETCTPSQAAHYLAKYQSKGVHLAETSPEFAARVLDMIWGKRTMSTSHGYWKPLPAHCACPTCNQPFTVVKTPDAGRRAARATWDPGVRIARGDPRAGPMRATWVTASAPTKAAATVWIEVRS